MKRIYIVGFIEFPTAEPRGIQRVIVVIPSVRMCDLVLVVKTSIMHYIKSHL
jgi:hypothetical protein